MSTSSWIFPVPRSRLLALALLGYLWFRLIDHLRIEWSINEQYNYGWAVPVLCGLLLWRRWRSRSLLPSGISTFRFPLSALSLCFLFLALSFIATRLIEIANPDWRLVSWAFALEVIFISIALIYLMAGSAKCGHFAFPIFFFLVAVPWPTVIEHPTVQFLTRGNVASTVEVLNLFGVLAVPHGNVIETANGLVDVDRACSGIRSLQAALMLALFFGEWHRFSTKPRIFLCVAGLGLAFLFNFARTLVLSLVAAKQGSAAVRQWHDPAGIAILIGCFTGVWAFAAWLSRQNSERLKTENLKSGLDVLASRSTVSALGSHFSIPQRFSVSAFLFVLTLVGEIAVYAWYRSVAPNAVVDWNVSLPRQKPAFTIAELPADTVRILRFTEGKSAKWENADGTHWQFFYFRWAPGRTAVNLARNHTPEICLPAAGHKLSAIPNATRVELEEIGISFRSFVTGNVERPVYVFYSLWEDGVVEQRSDSRFLTVESRLKAVRDRRRNPGQRVIEIAISGARDLAQAETSLQTELPKLIRVQSR